MKDIKLVKENDLAKFCADHRDKAVCMLGATRRIFGFASHVASSLLLPLADRSSKKWLEKTDNPYKDEIAQYAQALGVPGIYALNLSYEWGCSSGGISTKGAPDIMRVLDWPFPGLGDALMLVHQSHEAGEFYNATWPGLAGVYQAMAPGRFCAAINQAPMRRYGGSMARDWYKNRKLMFKQTTLPPAHLLRQVFETVKSYDEAKKILTETPICMPVLYTLTGIKAGEACVIERVENGAIVRELDPNTGRVAISNHFQTSVGEEHKTGWMPRPYNSDHRTQQVCDLDYQGLKAQDFSWLTPPIINYKTRLCMIANAKTGQLMLQGWEKDGPVTKVLKI